MPTVDEALPDDQVAREFAPVHLHDLQGLRRELDLQEVGHIDCDVLSPAVLGLELETDLAQVQEQNAAHEALLRGLEKLERAAQELAAVGSLEFEFVRCRP